MLWFVDWNQFLEMDSYDGNDSDSEPKKDGIMPSLLGILTLCSAIYHICPLLGQPGDNCASNASHLNCLLLTIHPPYRASYYY